MSSIFDNAYFGKPYRTRDGRKAIYHSYDNIYPDNSYQHHHNLILEEKDYIRDTIWIWCNDYGHIEEHIEGEWLNETNSDIVSEWQEVNEEELEKYAESVSEVFWHDDIEIFNGNPLEEEIYYVCQKCYKAGIKTGYHKAKTNSISVKKVKEIDKEELDKFAENLRNAFNAGFHKASEK